MSLLADDLKAVERRLNRLAGEARALATQGQKAQDEIVLLTDEIDAHAEAIGVLNRFADTRQAEVQAKIETLVTHGLRTVFGSEDEIAFHIRSTQRGSISAMDLVITSKFGDEVIETPILDARGGGVAAVAGFLLRLILLLLRKDARPVMFLDESFAQVSAEYEPKVADFLKELTTKTPVQIVLVTHSDAYADAADVVYRLRSEKAETKVERL